MFPCENCEKQFKTNWHLQRHLNKKIPCIDKTKFDYLGTKIDYSKTKNDYPETKNDYLICKYCNNTFSRVHYKNKHEETCKMKDDHVRNLEIQLGISYPCNIEKYTCRFCYHKSTKSSNLLKHTKSCKAKNEYKKKLEMKLKESMQKTYGHTTNYNNNSTNTVNILVTPNTIRRFGEESTDHISDSYLKKQMANYGISIPKIVCNVMKQIYCDDKHPENETIKISNLRSAWLHVSNGDGFEAIATEDALGAVREKVSDLYYERKFEKDFFQPVWNRIQKLEELDEVEHECSEEEKKRKLKLRAEVERNIKSDIYNKQKYGKKLLGN